MAAPVIDPATFAEFQDSAGADLVVQLVGFFLEESRALRAELAQAQQAQQVGDADCFCRAAHSVKPNSQTSGALALVALARQLELQGLHADPAHDEQTIAASSHADASAAAALKELARV